MVVTTTSNVLLVTAALDLILESPEAATTVKNAHAVLAMENPSTGLRMPATLRHHLENLPQGDASSVPRLSANTESARPKAAKAKPKRDSPEVATTKSEVAETPSKRVKTELSDEVVAVGPLSTANLVPESYDEKGFTNDLGAAFEAAVGPAGDSMIPQIGTAAASSSSAGSDNVAHSFFEDGDEY